jgi:hypothetical protein
LADTRNNPFFELFPLNNARTGYRPFSMPVVYIEPRRLDSNGNGIADSAALNVRYKVVNAPDPALVNGPFNQNLRIPDQSLFEIELTQTELQNKLIDIKKYTFYDSDGNSRTYEQAEEGDTFEYTLVGTTSTIDSNPTSSLTYYPDAYYYDLSDVEMDVSQLPLPKMYYFLWESIYFRRYATLVNDLKCISDEIGLSQITLYVNHPGDVHHFMYNSTPNHYFNYEGFKLEDDATLKFYRPLADALQDIYDEQNLLNGINHIRSIPSEYIPYLSYLIGWDLPNFPGTTDEIKRTVLRRGSELQKLKGSKRVINELFETFGYTVDIINLWTSLDGNSLLKPGEDLSVVNLTQTDLSLSDYTADGFGVGDVPFVHRPVRDSQVVLYAWLATEGSTKYDQLLELAENLSDDLEFANTVGTILNSEGYLEPAFVNTIGKTVSNGITGYSRVVVGASSTSVGRPVINHRNVSYNSVENILSLYFDHDMSIETDQKIFIFAVYERNKIIIPDELSNTRSNKFEIEILDRSDGQPADFDLLISLLEFLFKLKSFHSLLRKIIAVTRFYEVYNTIDMCIDGEDVLSSGTPLGDLKAPPATLRIEEACDNILTTQDSAFDISTTDGITLLLTSTECPECVEEFGFTDSEINLKNTILNGLEEEFQAWKSLSATGCEYTSRGQDKVADITDQTDQPNYDYDTDERETICEDGFPDVDFCYKGRVKDELTISPVNRNDEIYTFEPCGISLGDVIYWQKNQYNNPLNFNPDYTKLYSTQSSYLNNRNLSDDNTLTGLNYINVNIDIDNLGFPSHRFIRLNDLENDYNYTQAAVNDGYDRDIVRKRPWDTNGNCGRTDHLNAYLVQYSGYQELVWDDENLVYTGNGIEPDIPSLSDHTIGCQDDASVECDPIVTHAVYQYAEQSHPAISLDSIIESDYEFVDTDSLPTGAIFKSVCLDGSNAGIDYISGYPALINWQDSVSTTFEDGGSIVVTDGTAEEFDRSAISDAFGLPQFSSSTVDRARFFFNSMIYVDENDIEYKYYIPYRLDCGCLNDWCSVDSAEYGCSDQLFDSDGYLDPDSDKLEIELTPA